MERLPLSGMKVLEVAGLFPGPFATMALADLGADVVKAERPDGGDPVRWLIPGFFDSLNRNKRSVTVNLKHGHGREVLRRLAGWADVVVEGFRPGVAGRIGADYEALRGANPALIYCSITGYGQDGPYKNLPGHDLNYLGVAGAAGEGHTLLPGADTLAGTFAALSIVSAYVGRERDGEGAYIDLSMTESVVSAMAPVVNEYLARGRPDPADFAVRPAYGVYRASDGGLLSIGCTETVFWERLCRILGFDDLAADETLRSWSGRATRAPEIDARIRAEISTRTLDEWMDFFGAEHLPVAPINGLDEVASDPQLSARAQARTFPPDGKASAGAIQFGFPALFGGQRPGPRTPPPALGADTEEMLLDVGYSPDELRTLREAGAI